MDQEWHRRHPDFEVFDRVELVVVPRYKTSGLSGDEWRTSINAKFYFKGEVMHEQHFRDMKTAVALLPHALMTMEQMPERWHELEKAKCNQVGCPEDFVSKVRLKRLTSKQGEYLHPDEGSFTKAHVRQFCRKHVCRGNAGREDSDSNYEVLEGPGPDGSTNTKTSPSAGPVVLDLKTETRRKKKK